MLCLQILPMALCSLPLMPLGSAMEYSCLKCQEAGLEYVYVDSQDYSEIAHCASYLYGYMYDNSGHLILAASV